MFRGRREIDPCPSKGAPSEEHASPERQRVSTSYEAKGRLSNFIVIRVGATCGRPYGHAKSKMGDLRSPLRARQIHDPGRAHYEAHIRHRVQRQIRGCILRG